MEPGEPVQMNIYKSNIYTGDLSWLHLDDEPRVQERQQVKGQQSCISTFVTYPTIATRSTTPDFTTIFHAWLYGRFKEIKSNLRRNKLHRTSQSSNFLGGTFSDRDSVWAPIQFGSENQPQHLKRWFFLKNRHIHFHINSTSVIRPVKQNQLKDIRWRKKCKYFMKYPIYWRRFRCLTSSIRLQFCMTKF